MKRKEIFIFLSIFQILTIQTAYPSEVAIVRNNIEIKKSIKSWIEYKNEKVVKQQYDYSCGAASLATIFNYFFYENVVEKDIVEYVLEERVFDQKQRLEQKDFALSFKDLEEYAQTKGYNAIGLALPIESLKKLKVPAIVYVEIRSYQHFSVYKGMDDTFVYLADPSLGNIMLKIGRFKEIFYTREGLKYPGKVLVFIPQDKEKESDVNNAFTKAPAGSNFVHQVIKNKVIQGLLP